MLTDRQTQDVSRTWQGEAIDCNIVRYNRLLLELKVLELRRVEGFPRSYIASSISLLKLQLSIFFDS
jgi:hypothetical protein